MSVQWNPLSTTRIGPYELLAPLGEGGMGKVYRARDTRLERTVAIKFLHGRAVDDPDRRMRFLREARAEAALYHPNIATVLDVGEAEVDDPDLMPKDGGRPTRIVPYLVLEYVAGHDLRSRIQDGPLPLAETLRLARQIAAGLEAAHAAGIVHRDLKPANVLVTAGGLVKILDFGLARFVTPVPPTADSPTDLQTAEGAILGTPPYLAPEQAVGQPLDARADLFALGVMLFQMTTGTLPFRGDNPIDLLQSALRDEPFDLAEKAPGTPPRFAALVAKLLKKHPIDRPASAADVARELDAIAHELGDLPTSVTGAAGAATTSTLATMRSSQQRNRLIAVAAVLALAASAAAIFLRGRTRDEAEDFYRRGMEALDLEDRQAPRIAAQLFERAATIEPKFALAWSKAATAWAAAYAAEHTPALLESAERCARRAAELNPQLPDSQLAAALVDRAHGNLPRSIQALERLLAAGHNPSETHAELAETYEQSGDLGNAEEHLLAAISSDARPWKAWLALGGFRVRSGNYPGAKSAFEKAAGLAPAGKTTPAENLASLLFLEGKYEEALAAYEAIPTPLTTPEAASNLGTLLYFNGRFDRAEEFYRRSIQIAPKEPLYHRNLADALLRLNRTEEARSEYAAALELVDDLLQKTPRDSDLRTQKALYLARAGRCTEAIELATQLDAELPDSAWSQHALARPFALCSSIAEAIGRLRQAVSLGFSRDMLRDEDEFVSLRGVREFDLLVGAPAGGSVGR